MSDVLEIANERRSELKRELTDLDDFISMAESLIRGERPGQGRGGNVADAPVPLGRGDDSGLKLASRPRQ